MQYILLIAESESLSESRSADEKGAIKSLPSP